MPIPALLAKVEAMRRAVRKVKGLQIFAPGLKAELHSLATEYFTYVHPIARHHEGGSARLDQVFQEVHALSRKSPSKSKVVETLKTAKAALIECEGRTISAAVPRAEPEARLNPVDDLIVSTLNEVCPSASLAYQQALVDMRAEQRLSWRGPATDLREALRETLDVLAPDEEVTATPGFRLEADAKRPTMKQKVRHVLKNRGANSGELAPPESAVQGVEEFVGGLTRSVYTRSSVSTHTPTLRTEVTRVHAWVRVVLCELLEIPL